MSVGRVLLLVALLSAPLDGGLSPRTAETAVGCSLASIFLSLHDQIPAIVGACRDEARLDPATGNLEQRTTGGLLVWRSADQKVAFTDGVSTWIDGPDGLVSRANADPPFPWEIEAPGPPEQAPPIDQAPVKPVDCPRLDSQLYQLTQAPDPAEFARQAGLSYQDGAVLVIVVLHDGADLPPGYGLAEALRYANLVQLEVPVALLCPLANEPGVAAVRPPARPAPSTRAWPAHPRHNPTGDSSR